MVEAGYEQVAAHQVHHPDDGGARAELGDLRVEGLPVSGEVVRVKLTRGKRDVEITILIQALVVLSLADECISQFSKQNYHNRHGAAACYGRYNADYNQDYIFCFSKSEELNK